MVHENRRRYVVFHILEPENVGKGLIIKLTREATRKLDRNQFEKVKPWLVYYKNQWGIIRTGHLGREKMTEILNSLEGSDLREGTLRLRIIGVSGTLRSAFYKHIPEKARQNQHYRNRDPL
jgi:RNase P/RNase MRP subunit POP5